MMYIVAEDWYIKVTQYDLVEELANLIFIIVRTYMSVNQTEAKEDSLS